MISVITKDEAANAIDFVIPWVDGNDPEWSKRHDAVSGTLSTDDRAQRYRDWDVLRYWFRGVEKFAPWVRKVWFICDQTPPAWLNTAHPKLTVVRHEDYLPEAYRPAFSANPIELNLHRIEGLAEQFVYFNDDMFLLRPLPETFFFQKGLPRDSALLNPIPTDGLARKGADGRIFTIYLNNASYINRDYVFRQCLKKNLGKWLNPVYGRDCLRNALLCIWPRFLGSVEMHLPQAFLKRSFVAAWEQDGDILDETSRRHLRDDHDVNQWLIRLRQLMEGDFVPRKPIRDAVFVLGAQDREAQAAIRAQKLPMICLNDTSMDGTSFEQKRAKLQAAFAAILPERSAFEKENE